MFAYKLSKDDHREVFELFKIPIEAHRKGKKYACIITDLKNADGLDAKVIILKKERYGTEKANTLLFEDPSKLWESEEKDGTDFIYINYDIFGMISDTLAYGGIQKFSDRPLVEFHIDLLRDILRQRFDLAEVPPSPFGYEFMVAPTHDVDHCTLKEHMFDFSLREYIRNLIRKRDLQTLLRLPAVLAGISKDPFNNFETILDIEKKFRIKSTFYFIPPKKALDAPDKKPHRTRPAAYTLRKSLANRILGEGHELGVHGLNAWKDKKTAQEELEYLKEYSDAACGIRMHWLFGFRSDHDYGFTREDNLKTLRILSDAGYSYDTSLGYNNLPGFMAGTLQAYSPAGLKILELPQHIMDGSAKKDPRGVESVIDYAKRFGGAVTINWHNSSFGAFHPGLKEEYEFLIERCKKNAYINTANSIVSWFRMRRSLWFTSRETEREYVIGMHYTPDRALPGMKLRLHHKGKTRDLPLGSQVRIKKEMARSNKK